MRNRLCCANKVDLSLSVSIVIIRRPNFNRSFLLVGQYFILNFTDSKDTEKAYGALRRLKAYGALVQTYWYTLNFSGRLVLVHTPGT